MSSNIINQLPELQSYSNKRLSSTIKQKLKSNSEPRTLVKAFHIANANIGIRPAKGAASLAHISNRQSIRKVKTLSTGNEQLLNNLNRELMGGESYPILTTGAGMSGSRSIAKVGQLFSIYTTTISVLKTPHKVLARLGDEIWHVEEIGKVKNKAVYVSAFIILDPYRKHTPNDGWLIHEEREDLHLN